MKPKDFVVLALLTAIAMCGCGTPQTVVGPKPEDQLNPAMSPAMRNARLHGHAKSQG